MHNKPSSNPRAPSLNQLVAKLNSRNDSTTPSPTPLSSSSIPITNNTTTQIRTAGMTNSSLGAGGAMNSPSTRPRLAASVLRTGSTTSLTTTTSSNADSMAVQAPSTRSVSPSTTNGGVGTPTTPSSELPSGVIGSLGVGEPLTSEGLDRLNEQVGDFDKSLPLGASSSSTLVSTGGTTGGGGSATGGSAGAGGVPAKKVGYKNIPSLEAIAARMAEARQQLSVDGTSKPPDAELIEDPKTPGIPVKAPEHPLQYRWTMYHDSKAKFPSTPHVDGSFAASITANTAEPAATTTTTEYEAGLTVIGDFSSVESFCRYFNWLKPPSTLPKNSNYHLFKSGIKPMWEDPSNANGGKWVLTMKNNPGLLDRCWNWLAMALVGEELEDGDEICGAVVSLRSKVDRIQLWTRAKDDVEKLNGIGEKLIKLLDVSEADGIGLEFQYNTDDRPLPNKFLSIQAAPMSSYRSGFTHSGGAPPLASTITASPGCPVPSGKPAAAGSGSGNDFSGFGTGAGIGTGSGWRALRLQRGG